MSAFRKVTLTLPLDVGGSVSVRGHQSGPLALHPTIVPGGSVPRLGAGWDISHVATGLKLPLEALSTRQEAETLVGLLLGDERMWRAFSATTREAVQAAAPGDMQTRLLNFRHQSVCTK